MKRRVAIFLVAGVSVVTFVLLAAKLLYDHFKVHEVTIATAAEWGEYHKFGTALARVVERHNPKLRITVVKTKGSIDNVELLQKGEVDFAIVQNNVLVDPDVEAGAVRAVATLFPEVFHLIAAKDSGIRSVCDLKGKRVALMPGGSGSRHLFMQILQQHGLSQKEVEVRSFDQQEILGQLRDGKVDAVSHTLALGNEVVRDLLTNSDGYLVPVANVKAMQIWIPYLVDCEIPAGTYDHSPLVPEENIPAAGVRAMLLTREDMSEQLVFDVSDVLERFHADLVTEYPYALEMSAPFTRGACIPQHPGAIHYSHRKDPSFLVKYAEFLALLLTVGLLLGTWLLRLHMFVQAQRKDRADKYNLDILSLLEKVHATESTEGLEEAREELLKIFRQMIEDLDQDRITTEAFPSFAFTWEMVFREIHHREEVIRRNVAPDR